MRSSLAQTLGGLCLALAVGEAMLALLSWILSATMTPGVRSLLSDEGVRWFFGSFTAMVGSPQLAWLVLLLIAAGCVSSSDILKAQHSYRGRMALRVALLFLIIYVVLILLLTATPHATLLSATGSLFPSPFSRSIVPVAAFGATLVSLVFGLMAGRFRTLADVVGALSEGIRRGAPLFILYILLLQLCESLRFVFGF